MFATVYREKGVSQEWLDTIVSIKCCKKSIEHHVKVFFVVIDPKEAYDQFRIRRELGGVIVAIVGSKVGVEWLSIVVVFSSSDSAPIFVSVCYLSQVGSTALGLGCC